MSIFSLFCLQALAVEKQVIKYRKEGFTRVTQRRQISAEKDDLHSFYFFEQDPQIIPIFMTAVTLYSKSYQNNNILTLWMHLGVSS